MKQNFSRIAIWLAAVLLAGSFVTAVRAADQTKLERLEGRVQMIDWNTSTITVGVHITSGATRVNRYVVFDKTTKFTYRNKPGSSDMVKDGRRVICLGKYDGDGKFVADRVDVRNQD